MAEQPVGANTMSHAGDGADAELLAMPGRRHVPQVVVRADLLPSLGVFAVLAVVGVPLGWVWSAVAPPALFQSLGGGRLLLEPLEDYHRFDDMALFLLIALGSGLVAGAALWLRRSRRGPVYLVAAVAGAAVGTWLAMRVGLFFAASSYPAAPGAQAGAMVAMAPRLDSTWVLIAQPLAVALAYGTLAAWNGMDDLGRRLD